MPTLTTEFDGGYQAAVFLRAAGEYAASRGVKNLAMAYDDNLEYSIELDFPQPNNPHSRIEPRYTVRAIGDRYGLQTRIEFQGRLTEEAAELLDSEDDIGLSEMLEGQNLASKSDVRPLGLPTPEEEAV